MLRQVPAIAEVALLEAKGRERLRVSRQAMNKVGSNTDYSGERGSSQRSRKGLLGPVDFRRGTEPYMALAWLERAAMPA